MQIQKYAKLGIKANDSRKHKGISGITEPGRKWLRTILFQVIMPIVGCKVEFKELHHYYTTRQKNPLKRKQSLIALCCKLMRILYGIAIKGFEYDDEKLLNDIIKPQEFITA